MIVIGGLRNWSYEIVLSVDLMWTFVQGVEKQAAESIQNYRAKRSSEGHEGLDSETWDLDLLFEQYFPNLQRRSALLTLWGVVEHELNELCLCFQREKGLQLSPNDLSGRGIVRSSNYLEKVVGINGLQDSPEWGELKALQTIRNCVAHNDGKVIDRDGKVKNDLVNATKRVGFAKCQADIVFEKGFLTRAVGICEGYFLLIGKYIDTQKSGHISTFGNQTSQ